MEPRLDPYKTAPKIMQLMLDLQAKVAACGLEHSLQELVKIRASQINGCAFCVHMHTLDARKAGETEERLYLLNSWRESPLYSDRERAALAWTEALTVLSETRAPDEVYAQLKAQFSDEDQVKLTMLIATINAWNRFGVGFRKVHPVTSSAKAHVAA